MKIASRKFTATTSTSALVIANEALGLGFNSTMMFAVLGLAAVYAFCEAWVDVTRIRTGSLKARMNAPATNP